MNSPSLFDPEDRRAILARIEGLQPDAIRRWGKMSVAQMLAHCELPLRVATGDLPLKRSLIGLLFGRLAKKKLLSPEPWKPGMPTAPEFRIAGEHDFVGAKAALLERTRRFGESGPAGLTKLPHPFFGPMTDEEWQTLQWKHLDHHLRQFGG